MPQRKERDRVVHRVTRVQVHLYPPRKVTHDVVQNVCDEMLRIINFHPVREIHQVHVDAAVVRVVVRLVGAAHALNRTRA